jgi:hydroxymethylpyrimidine pyrophosphatase-like HAD family hydrolase
VAVAVANALPEVKAIADFLTRSNDEHALADLIEHIIPKL